MGGTGGQRGLDLVDAIDLNNDPLDSGFARATHSLAHAAGDRDMIVLDHRGVPQAHAMIGGAAHARRIFLEEAQARNGLARIEQRRTGACDPVDIAARQRRHARQMLDRIER